MVTLSKDVQNLDDMKRNVKEINVDINILEGTLGRKRYRGRPRLQYVQQIMEDVGCGRYVDVKRSAVQ